MAEKMLSMNKCFPVDATSNILVTITITITKSKRNSFTVIKTKISKRSKLKQCLYQTSGKIPIKHRWVPYDKVLTVGNRGL